MVVKFIDLNRIYQRYEEEVKEVLDKCFSHQKWILGPEVEKLEQAAQRYLGVRHCLGVSSGTDALVLSLRALAIKRGKQFFDSDELVITTPFTFVATAEAIIRSGARPLFVDVREDDLNISVSAIEHALKTYGSKVIGVVAVHIYGRPCEVASISELCKKYGIFLVEDCAQAFGAQHKDKRVGSFGDVGAFSFFPTKNLPGIGDGGLVSTNDSELYEILVKLRNHGGRDKYDIEHIGYNARLDTIQAAVLEVYLRHIDELISFRQKNAQVYWQAFSRFSGTILCPPREEHTYNLYTIQLLGGNRDELLSKLHQEGISCGVYYPVLLNEMPPIRENSLSMPTPTAESVKGRVLSLPCFPFMNQEELDEVVRAVLKHLPQP